MNDFTVGEHGQVGVSFGGVCRHGAPGKDGKVELGAEPGTAAIKAYKQWQTHLDDVSRGVTAPSATTMALGEMIADIGTKPGVPSCSSGAKATGIKVKPPKPK